MQPHVPFLDKPSILVPMAQLSGPVRHVPAVVFVGLLVYTHMNILVALWLFNGAMENDPFIDDKHHELPIENGDFPVRYDQKPDGTFP